MTYTIEQIEDAIISALEPLKSSLGVRTIKTYQGELESEEDIERFIRKLMGLFPAVFVAYGGSEYPDKGMRSVEDMVFTLFVCDRSLRGEEEAARGGAGNPGAYSVLDGIRTLLHGKKLSLDVYSFRLVRQGAVWFGKGAAVYAAVYGLGQRL